VVPLGLKLEVLGIWWNNLNELALSAAARLF